MSLPIENSQIEHTTAEWTSLNPVLALNVIGVEVMSNGYNRYKRGDGATHWASLSYLKQEYIIPIDDVPTDGSSNPVSSNGVFNALTGKAATAHSHSAADITSGTLPVTRGGTGATTAAAALTSLGAQKNLSPVNSTATSVSVPTNAGTVLKSQSLSAGTYLLFGYAQFPNNSTGLRGISISTSSTFDDGKATKTPACNGWETAITCWSYFSLASTATVYLAAFQNSGSTLTVSTVNLLALKVA